MSQLKQIIMEMVMTKLYESVDIIQHYSQAPRSESSDIPKDVHVWAKTHPSKETKVEYAGGLKHKDGTMHLSVFHHNNGHTYVRDHGDGVVYKSNKQAKHKAKDLLKSYAENSAEDEKNFKTV